MLKPFQLAFLLFSLPFVGLAQVDHWESVILEGDEWNYTVPTSQPAATWTNVAFDASGWNTGNSGFGFGDEDDNTVLPNGIPAVYIRKIFTVTDRSAIDELVLHLDYDDGFVAYLNGVEIARDLVSGNPPNFDQFTDGLHEAVLYQGQTPSRFDIDASLLNEGNNVLAIEVHNESTTSSDLSAIPFLSFGINDDSNNYRPTPSWFSAPIDIQFTSSNLPIVLINTQNGAEIQDEPKILAEMKIVYRGESEHTFLTDQNDESFIDYSGTIKIEGRGSTSQSLPKKPYGFTTYNSTGSLKENVSLLGMPKENDWILNSLAFDPSLMRDYLSYNLSRKIGEYATRTQYCEVILNGTYKGLYVLQEKMKADDNRIDINKINPEDNALPKLSGGYITKADKTTGGDPVAWQMPNYSGWTTDFIHEVPKPEEVTNAQNVYIQGQFETLRSTSLARNATIKNGYPSIIDIPSFVNFILINELASNADAYQFSTYFHKDRGGKLRAGPIWDLNLSFGNDLFLWGFDRSHTDVWQFDFDNRGATFWRDLFENTDFKCYLSKRWNELTQPGQPFHLASLEASIDETVVLISEAAERENATWGTVPNHAEEIANLKIWIAARIVWMTQQLGSFSSCSNVSTPSLVISGIHYHPKSEEYDEGDLEFIEIHNNGTQTEDLSGIYFGGTGLAYQFPLDSKIQAGATIVLSSNATTFSQSYGFPPFGEFYRNLANNGQTLSLLDAFGNVIDQVTYMDEAPWPVEADGDGYCLKLVDATHDNNDPANWIAEQPTFSEWELANTSEMDFVVFPNPTHSSIQIRGKQLVEEVIVSDLEGKIVYQNTPFSTEHEIKLSAESKGFFLIRIFYETGVVVRKVFVQ